MSRVLILMGMMACFMQVNAQSISLKSMTNNSQIVEVSSNEYYQLDSISTYTDNSNNWQLDSREKFKYDSQKNITEELIQTLSFNTWQNDQKIKYSYSSDYLHCYISSSNWNPSSSSWAYEWRKKVDLNNSRTQLSIEYQESEGGASIWNKVWVQRQVYNNNDQLLSYETDWWNESGSQWESYWKYDCIYDTEGNLLEVQNKSYNQSSNNWSNEIECINNYMNTGELAFQNVNAWNNDQNDWQPLRHVNYTQPSSNSELETRENWNENNNSWDSSTRLDKVFDASGNTTRINYQLWNAAQNDWVTQRIDEFTFNSADIKIKEVTKFYNNQTGHWDNYLQKNYHYTKVVSSDIGDIDDPELRIYPNPTSSYLFLDYADTANEIMIYNIEGKKVIVVEPESSGMSIDVNSLKTGIYIIVVKFDTGVSRVKFLKE